MNADDDFIAAILAAPGDPAPRLAYADWLRGRGDSRADFLLAESEWAEARGDADAERLRRAAAHDPVWVARVSRPPVGICSDRVRFPRRPGGLARPTLSDADLDWVERRFRLSLPADYRAFLLNHNGGAPTPHRFRFPGVTYDAGDSDGVSALCSVWAAREPETDNDLDLIWMLKFLEEVRADEATYRGESPRWRGTPHADLMIFGYGLPYRHLHYLCLGCRGEAHGKVFGVTPYLMSPDEEDYRLAAPTFAAFVRMLELDDGTAP